MIYFYRRGDEALTCETRLAASGDGYELVVTERAASMVETFAELADMLAREHELLQAWRALGWREVSPGAPQRRD